METYFDASAGSEYINTAGFHSYFLMFSDGRARLELMWNGTQLANEDDQPHDGYGHVAVSVSSKETVEALAAQPHGQRFPLPKRATHHQ